MKYLEGKYNTIYMYITEPALHIHIICITIISSIMWDFFI